ncbi:MAG TPA: ABC transporter substrate-binding protein [Jatrophihabitans sp.]|jgi:branched-chain amino acid transport system substrate-binding protein
MRVWIRGTAIACLALALTACSSSGGTAPGSSSAGGGSSNSAGSTPFVVLDITAQTGALAAIGVPETVATKAAVAYLNSKGGIAGHPIQLVVKDDLSTATTAVTVLQQELNSGVKPNLVLPGVTSDETVALLPALASNKLLSLASTGDASITDTAKYPLSFGGSFRPQDGSDALASYLQTQGYHNIGVFYAGDAYGTSWYKNVSASLKAKSLNVEDVSYDPTKIDLTAEMSRLQSQHPDVVIAEAFGAPVGALFNARTKIGWFSTPLVADITISSGDPWSIVKNPNAFQNVVEQIYSVQKYAPASSQSPAVQNLLAWVQKQQAITGSISLYALNWDMLESVRAAAAKAGSIDASAIATALTQLTDSDGQWAQNGGKAPGYTATSHFAAASSTNYDFIAPGPLKDGMVQPPS